MNELTTNVPEVDLSVSIAGLRLANPVIAASGTFGYGHEYEGLVDAASLGGIATKGLTLAARAGNRGIRLHETPAGLMNSIGLENPGIRAFIEEELPGLRRLGTVVFANLSGGSLEDYEEGAALLDGALGVDAIELNVSCPNVRQGGMNFGLDPVVAAEVVALVRSRTRKPLVVKLSPNAPDLVAVARACVGAGADARFAPAPGQGPRPRPHPCPDQFPVDPPPHGLGQGVEVFGQFRVARLAQPLRVSGQHHQQGLEPMGQVGGPGARPLDGLVLGL